jgi:hypothetical protein
MRLIHQHRPGFIISVVPVAGSGKIPGLIWLQNQKSASSVEVIKKQVQPVSLHTR